MKIGRFAEINGLSIDTIRHYMELGLVVPEKRGGQYYFDDTCQNDLNEVIELKGIGFALNEIKTIFLFKSFGKLTPYQQDQHFKSFFQNKYDSIQEEIHRLSETKIKLEEKIQRLSDIIPKSNFKIGIDIKILNLLSCLKCQGNLTLSEGSIIDNQIIDGKLRCRCGEEYTIKSGILRIPDSDKDDDLEFQYNLDYIGKYIKDTDTAYLENIHRMLHWIENKVDFSNFNNKILLELGFGVGLFLRYFYDNLPEDCVYIAVDNDINRHTFVKNMLEMSDLKRNIIFICCDFLKMPLKNKCADVLVDFAGTTNYSFKQTDFLLSLIDHHVKDNSLLLGTYILFKNFSFNSLIGEKYKRNFILKNVKEGIEKLGYKTINDNTSNYVEKGGVYENFFTSGEKIYDYTIIAER